MSMRMRDSRRFYEQQRIHQTLFSNMSKNELYAVVYYLFELTKHISNSEVMSCDESGALLNQLAINLGLRERMDEVLSSYIDCLCEAGKLHYCEKKDEDDEENDLGRVGRSRSRRFASFLYEEDEDIDRECDMQYSSTVAKNFYRTLYCEKSGSYSQILYYTFFTSTKINPFKIQEKVPVKFQKIGMDVSKVRYLKKELNLTDEETGYLQLRYYKAVVPMLSDVIDKLTRNSSEFYQKVLKLTKAEFGKIIRPDGKIRQFGFISDERNLNTALIESIEAQDLSVYFSDLVKKADLENTYDLSSFCVPAENTKIYKSILKSEGPCSLLIYGQPGSGKTQYVNALTKSTGKKVLIFKNEAETVAKSDAMQRLNCFLSLDRKDSILIVDEADTLLSTMDMNFFGQAIASKSKGLVNKMLENSKNKVIFIANYINRIDHSTLRRITCSYQFEAMTPAMLESIAARKLDYLNLREEVKKEILLMFDKYKVTGASVDNMVKAINCMKCKSDRQLIENVEIVLKDNSLLLYGKSKTREAVKKGYDLSVLNTSISSTRLVRMLQNAKKYAAENPGNGSLRLLFFGLSGTGKTEFARYISQMLGKKILLKRASDIFDKYVGGTEENIANAFKEAEDNDMILLFDEADSFFADRANASRNFERSQVNEFLVQLENFSGIVICTSNLRGNGAMDPAMLRRFNLTVEFKALQEEGIRKLLNSYFPSYDFCEEYIHRLINYDSVTPGDFGRLSDTVRFMDSIDVNEEYIIEELCNIQEEKNRNDGVVSSSRKVGFCA